MCIDKGVHVGACTVAAGCGVGDHCLGSGELLAALQRPCKVLRIDSALESSKSERALLYDLPVVAGIDQVESVALAAAGRAVRALKEHRRIVESTGDAAGGAQLDDSLLKMPARHAAFACPGTVEGNHVPVCVRQVKLQACQIADDYLLLCSVGQDAGPDKDIALGEHGVVQREYDRESLVQKLNLEGSGLGWLLGVGLGNQAGEIGLALDEPVRPVGEIQRCHAVGILHLHGRRAEIALSRSACLKAHGVHENQRLSFRVGHACSYTDHTFLCKGIQIRIGSEPSSIVQVLQVSGLADAYDV